MTGRIITARHGRPNLSRDVKITAAEYGDWWVRYDASGLHPDERPPQSLVDLAAKSATVLSSTLPRAIETARQATRGGREVPADPLYVEAPLPPPPVPLIKLSPTSWGVISRFFWIFGYAPNGVESHCQAWARVEQAIERLTRETASGDVLLCAHGYFNWMLDKRLRALGWRRASREGSNEFWSWRVYEPPAGANAAARAAAAAE